MSVDRCEFTVEFADANTQQPHGLVAVGKDTAGRSMCIVSLSDGKFRNLTTCTANTIADALTAPWVSLTKC